MTRASVVRMCRVLMLLAALALPAQAWAEQRVIVRTISLLDGLPLVTSACRILGCTVLYGLDGTLKRLFLVSVPDLLNVNLVAALLPTIPGIVAAEVDQPVRVSSAVATGVPPALLDAQAVSYYGNTVRGGYVRQPAVDIVGLDAARQEYGLTGSGITVAVIDTGVDFGHPALQGVLLNGYDFTRNRHGGSESGDVVQSTVAVLDDALPGFVTQSTVAVLDEDSIELLSDPQYAGFGHGTVVAGLVHLTAPGAAIMPLKAFRADGSGFSSDVLRAIYYAVREGAKVLNMSFSFSTRSPELERTLDYATSRGLIAVAAAGNSGQRVDVYPASLGTVMGVASTTDWDNLSMFSNFGSSVAWIAAPGEGLVSTYPFGTYAAVWGTSFSTPLASGAAALLAQLTRSISNAQAADAAGHAVWISQDVSKGRLDVRAAIRAWRDRIGLP